MLLVQNQLIPSHTMITQNPIFLTISSLLILSLLNNLFQTCVANSYCSPSACGIFPNISSPFRLKGHPKKCGDGRFELACENNVTSISLNSHKYYVKAINYSNSAIRLVDASINNHDICSFPTLFDFSIDPRFYFYVTRYSNSPINFISCPNQLTNSSLFTDITTQCASNSSHPRYAYIKVGHMTASELPYSCGVDLIVMTSWQEFKDFNNVSLSEIHQSLLYGLELYFCTQSWCGSSTKLNWGLLLIPLALLVRGVESTKTERNLILTPPKKMPVFIIAGVSLPLTIIIGIIGVLVLSFASISISGRLDGVPYKFSNYFSALQVQSLGTTNFSSIALLVSCVAIIVLLSAAINPLLTIITGFGGVLLVSFILIHNRSFSTIMNEATRFLFIGVISGIVISLPKIIIGPFVVWFLIYKFRRRRLSVYEEIEGFLKSDNKLSPIRYSYSDIKKMTRGFREKLGQGGFGSVYKGKLRSGHDVAVKLLGKATTNGQDFINEIGTIGRIHHVNVVKLVGYCAEMSKRALIFDFMPNGSLEKYIFNREKTSSLDWDMKFKIAVEVARGIKYLHCGCDIQILHFDIKPHNILLDDKFVPKISDFGLAKLCSIEKDTVTMTAARGTIGYVAPELINRSIGGVSYKADVYSFGMLLMEMIGLNRELKGNNDDSSKYFPEWIYDHFNQGKDIEIEKAEENNGNDDENESRKSLVHKMTIVALWCIQIRPDDRPSMHKVLEMLEADVKHLHIPDYPPQSADVAGNEEESWRTDATDSVSQLHYNNGSSIEITIA
ncbi:LEAF RUST 10 DISEASE-RESISTANCE LOCUS RECEPTOR-LIKE PROTEIN KINASE-like 2.8 isoform X2 [Salvia miltiorrhiza]|uniref:LEAF RUST 10 DISEASE-RESISTANCE LOCUS RECEPTOR-LIKE PROTEIN KINASE-like 2.8 isoform X2 n=1 Tax=Salvia miltiorrhiza TaxID=226208 RepID=UPI0025AD9A66|nr:LEAF RUST 10 DISEASE-RESISTANCE LOCUS RECEPTOR-LIKE PROTEIN KINASE-like 2.8 isoform X2 [Salvia miltiorrhiza]